MRVFVTGGSGFIGGAVVPELLEGGHRVVALARSDASADALAAAGAEVRRGGLEDLHVLRAGAAEADGVIHMAFIHDFSNFAASARIDDLAIQALGGALVGTGKPLVVSAGVLNFSGGLLTERDEPTVPPGVSGRLAGVRSALAFSARGVRSSIMRLAPTVHGRGDHGFVPRLVAIAREKGVSGIVGDGQNRWPAVHRLDAARLFRLALEKAPAGTAVHAVGEEGVRIGDIAEVIGRHVGVPVKSFAPDDAPAHFGFLAGFVGLDSPASNTLTREMLGWEPEHPGLLADLDAGHYFGAR
jgi:nucleoside-diphosphate-sugar epimerase